MPCFLSIVSYLVCPSYYRLSLDCFQMLFEVSVNVLKGSFDPIYYLLPTIYYLLHIDDLNMALLFPIYYLQSIISHLLLLSPIYYLLALVGRQMVLGKTLVGLQNNFEGSICSIISYLVCPIYYVLSTIFRFLQMVFEVSLDSLSGVFRGSISHLLSTTYYLLSTVYR